MAISKIATKGKQFYEALKDTEKALKIKDPDKRNNALQRAGEKATNADPEARAAKKISDQKYRDDFIAEKKARDLGFKVGGAVKAVKKCKRDGIAVRGRTKGRMV